MRNVDGNHWDSRLEKLLGDGRRDRLVGLEFDYQINFFANEMVRITQRYLWIVAVINHDQFEMKCLRSSQQTRFDLLRK